jgi:threonine/homoserine/homoserine lactone efflux protein
MTAMLDIIRNIVLGITLAAPVGPVNIEIIKRGLKHGFYPAFLLSLGAVSADATYLLAVYFGLCGFIHIPLVKTGIWIAGAFVLVYLGSLSIKEYFGRIDFQRTNARANRSSFAAGYLITLSNPMTIVWWVGIFGAVIGGSFQGTSKTLTLLNSFMIIVGALLWFFGLCLLLHWGKRFINEKNMRYVSLFAGVAIFGFGLYFGYRAAVSIF